MSDQTITSLIEKLEGAEVGSRELDCAIWTATGGWDHVGRPPTFSTSLDAALALAERVLPGWEFGAYINRPDVNGRRFTMIEAHRWQDVGPEYASACVSSKAATPALALCAALLRAQSEARV